MARIEDVMKISIAVLFVCFLSFLANAGEKPSVSFGTGSLEIPVGRYRSGSKPSCTVTISYDSSSDLVNFNLVGCSQDFGDKLLSVPRSNFKARITGGLPGHSADLIALSGSSMWKKDDVIEHDTDEKVEMFLHDRTHSLK